MSRTSIAVSAASLGAFAAIATTTLVAQQPITGELTPPSGPVGDTSPSLAELQSTLDALSSSFGSVNGPWLSKTFGGTVTLTSTPVADGPVLVHKVIVSSAYFALFDGDGVITPSGEVTSGNGIISAYNGGNGVDEVVLNVVSDQDLELSYNPLGGVRANVTVLYRPVPQP